MEDALQRIGEKTVKIKRSSKCSLKFTTHQKRQELNKVLVEYGRVVNLFIDYFWIHGCPLKSKLLKPIVDIPLTWLSARLRKVAAREAMSDMRKKSLLRGWVVVLR